MASTKCTYVGDMLLVCLNKLLGCLVYNMKYICHENMFAETSSSSYGKSMLN
jgi:hypothetical protein